MKLSSFAVGFYAFEEALGRSVKTLSEHRYTLEISVLPVLGEKEIDELTVNDAVYVMQAGRKHGIFGPQRAIICLRLLLKYIHDSGVKLPFYWKDIKLPYVGEKRVEYLSAEEIEKIRQIFSEDSLSCLRTRAGIEILADTGMRIGELCSLDKKDVFWDNREILVTNIKTKKEEKVYFTPRSAAHLKRYLEKRKDNLPALFVTGRDRMLPHSFRNFFRDKTKHLDLQKHVYPHIFRKTFVTNLLQHGVDIKTVQTLARHKDERTTLKHYAGTSLDRAKAEYKRVMED